MAQADSIFKVAKLNKVYDGIQWAELTHFLPYSSIAYMSKVGLWSFSLSTCLGLIDSYSD